MKRHIIRHSDSGFELRACGDRLLMLPCPDASVSDSSELPPRETNMSCHSTLLHCALLDTISCQRGAVTNVAFSSLQVAAPSTSTAVSVPSSHSPPFLVAGSTDKSCLIVSDAAEASRTERCGSSSLPVPSRSFRPLHRFLHPSFDEGVSCVAISCNDELIAAAAGKSLRIWSAQTRHATCQQEKERLITTPHIIFCIAFCQDAATGGRLLIAAGMYNSRILVFDAATGERIHATAMHGHSSKVTALLFSSSPPAAAPSATAAQPQPPLLLFSASADKTLAVWDARKGERCSVIETGHTRPLTALSFAAPDESVLAVGSEDATVSLWQRCRTDWLTSRLIQRLGGHEDAVSCLCYSPVTRVLFSGSFDRCVRAWKVDCAVSAAAAAAQERFVSPPSTAVTEGHLEASLPAHEHQASVIVSCLTPEPVFANGGYVRSIAVSSCGTTLALGLWDKQIQLWCVAEIFHRVVTPAATLAASGSFSGRPLHPFPAVRSVRVAPVGELVDEMILIKCPPSATTTTTHQPVAPSPRAASFDVLFCACKTAGTVAVGSVARSMRTNIVTTTKQRTQLSVLQRALIFSSTSSTAVDVSYSAGCSVFASKRLLQHLPASIESLAFEQAGSFSAVDSLHWLLHPEDKGAERRLRLEHHRALLLLQDENDKRNGVAENRANDDDADQRSSNNNNNNTNMMRAEEYKTCWPPLAAIGFGAHLVDGWKKMLERSLRATNPLSKQECLPPHSRSAAAINSFVLCPEARSLSSFEFWSALLKYGVTTIVSMEPQHPAGEEREAQEKNDVLVGSYIKSALRLDQDEKEEEIGGVVQNDIITIERVSQSELSVTRCCTNNSNIKISTSNVCFLKPPHQHAHGIISHVRSLLSALEQEEMIVKRAATQHASASSISCVCCDSDAGSASAFFVCCYIIRQLLLRTQESKTSCGDDVNVLSLVAGVVAFVKKRRPVPGCLEDSELFKKLLSFCLEEFDLK